MADGSGRDDLPVVALIGRTNVGKSTLFNRLIRSNLALTHDRPGVTRDRIYGEVRSAEPPFAVVDTGGLDLDSAGDIEKQIFQQAREAIEEAELVLLVVDGRAGLSPLDEQLAEFVRRASVPIRLVVNKVDGPELDERLSAEFHSLGLELTAVSAEHGYGVKGLVADIAACVPDRPEVDAAESGTGGLRLALLGRPNVGKSSLINALIGEQRLIVHSEAGTTRDCVNVDLCREGIWYRFLDTAGVRRKSRVCDSLERFSVLRALKTSQRAQVTILVLDGVEGLTGQDKRLLAHLDREKTPLIIAVNKVDLIPKQDRPKLKRFFEQELAFCPHVPIIYTSSVTRAGLGGLLPLAERLWEECSRRIGTGELNRVLEEATRRHQPPVVKGRRPKFYYVTQAESTPPTFVFFMNDRTLLKRQYERYLEKQIRKLFQFSMTPIQLHFRTSRG
jgi:GTP-binding protein